MINALLLVLLAAAPPALHPVSVTVFYDENGNGVRDKGEDVRLPDVLVEASGMSSRTTAGTAHFELPEGVHEVSIAPGTLPPFYAAGAPVRVDVPRDREVAIPVGLPIGANHPNTYLAFGDSITEGEGSSDGRGFCQRLEVRLRRHLGEARVESDGISGANTDRGIRRIKDSLGKAHPAYTLVLLGTNDWDDSRPPEQVAQETVANLRTILRRVKAEGSNPVVSTLPPPNVGFDWRVPRERDQWVVLVNRLIVPMAKEEGAVLADLYGAFSRQPTSPKLFKDHLHPNDHGYEVIAEAFFETIVGKSPPSPEGVGPAPASVTSRP